MVNMDWICVVFFFKSVNVGRENVENLIPRFLSYFFDRSMEELCPSMTTSPVIQNGGVPNVQSTVQSRIICCP